MARKVETIGDLVIRLLEEALTERSIAWVRKGGGLQIALLGNPEISSTDETISFSFIAGTSGFYGSKVFQHLVFSHGDPSCPDVDVKVTIERVLKAIDALNALMACADNQNKGCWRCEWHKSHRVPAKQQSENGSRPTVPIPQFTVLKRRTVHSSSAVNSKTNTITYSE